MFSMIFAGEVEPELRRYAVTKESLGMRVAALREQYRLYCLGSESFAGFFTPRAERGRCSRTYFD